MNRSNVLRRKLIYLTVLVLSLIPLYLLGQPSGTGGDGGGQLAEMRDEFDIAESDLGEISPASETMKLASLGLRGVAASLLWKKSHEYRVKHEWDRLKATLNNIALLQPHFDKVWEFQAHNLAYNVSTEFDDYRQRYEMVREGTEFLTKGVKQNRKAPRLIWYTGWFYGQKMGMSDEKRQFRRLFADDKILHSRLLDQGITVDSPEARGPLGKPDNWLVGRLWLNSGYDLVGSGVKIRRQTPLNFYETGPKWRFKHAEAIEDEGVLDERAQTAWQLAYEDWNELGERSIPTTSAFTIKLGRLDDLERQGEEKLEAFKRVTGDAYVEAQEAMLDQIAPIQKEAYLTPENERTKAQQSMAALALKQIHPDVNAVAKATDAKNRLEAVQLAAELTDLGERFNKTRGYRDQINYTYWRTLSIAEQEERTVRARRLTYEAEQANADAELDKAIGLYEQAFEVWAEIFDDYPILVIDDTANDLFDSVRRYMIATDSEELPEDFPLKTFVSLMGEYGQVDQKMYEEVRQTQREKMERRQRELAEQERRVEEEAAKADATAPEPTEMKADADKADSASDSDKEAESDQPKSEGQESNADAEMKEANAESESTGDSASKETVDAKDDKPSDAKEAEMKPAVSEAEEKSEVPSSKDESAAPEETADVPDASEAIDPPSPDEAQKSE